MEPLIVKLRETRDGDEVRWFVRGIYPDRLFGDVTYTYGQKEDGTAAGRQRNVEASLEHQVYLEIAKRAESIRAREKEPASQVAGWRGLLAFGKPGIATDIFHYQDGDEQQHASAREFLELVELLRPYLDS